MTSATTDPTNASSITVTVQFSEAVWGFTAGDIAPVANGTVSNFTPVDADTYTFDLSPTAQGTVSAAIGVGTYADSDGAGGFLQFNATVTNFSRTYDITKPTATIDQAPGQSDPAAGANPVNFRIVFSEAVTGFDSGADVALSGTAVPTSAVITQISPTTYNVAVSGMSQSGTVIATLLAGVAQDLAGNASNASTSTDNLVDYIRNEISDFNNDGKSDLVWQADANGASVLWYLGGPNGYTKQSDGVIYNQPSGGWVIVGVGDFNGDGQVDIVAQNGGTVIVAFMSANTVTSTQALSIVAFAGWNVRAVADIDDDGKSDLIWQGPDGRVYAWLMNGTTIATQVAIFDGPIPGWTIRGAADFSGDNKTDILWQYTDGRVVAWQMNGTAKTGDLTIYNAPVPGWTIRGAADVNGDTKPDLVWQGPDGRVVAWLMNGVTKTADGVIWGGPVPGWTIRAVR
jgi:hypothetical protein